MKNLFIIFTSVLFFGCTQKSTNHDLIIANVSLIDGTGNTVQEGVTVSIDNGSIIAISDTLPQQVENVIDGTGKYLMPGFFDCHVHTGDYERDFPRFIHYGVTSVFITGGGTCTNEYYAAMRERGSQDTIPAPRVFHTSQHFSMEGRHPSKTYAGSNWRDGETIFYLKDTLQIEKLVQQVAQYPIKGIKLTIEDGPAPPFVDRIPQAFVDKTVKEAKKYGLSVFAHVSDNIELEMAARAGVQNLVHYTGVNINPNDSTHLNIIQQLRARNASWVTTLMIDKSFLYPANPAWMENQDMLAAYQQMKSELTPERIERANFYIGLLKEEYGLDESTLEAFMKPQVSDIQYLFENGINMVLGTDTGNDFNFPGYSLHEEMQLLEMGGMAPVDIIKMGTLNAAKMLEVDSSLGSIEVGKTADMILLDKDPLESIANTLAINTVIKNGVVQRRIK